MTLTSISEGIHVQSNLFLWGLLSGVVVWFLYDLLRLWRRILPHGVIWMAAEDILFFFVCAVTGFQLLYPQSLGELRFFFVLAFILGSTGYLKIVSSRLIGIGEKLIHTVKKLLRRIIFRKKKKTEIESQIPIEK